MSTHSRFIHPNAQERKESLPSISKFAIKSASLLVCSTPTLLSLSPHVISSVSNLIPVPFIRPKLAIASPIEPPIKVDGRKFNKGAVGRDSYSINFKASCIDGYLEIKENKPKYSQDEHALKNKITQGKFSKWLKKQLFKCRPTGPKYTCIEDELVSKFRIQGKKGAESLQFGSRKML